MNEGRIEDIGYALVCEACGFYVFFPDGEKLIRALERTWAKHSQYHPECESNESMLKISADTFREAIRETMPQHTEN